MVVVQVGDQDGVEIGHLLRRRRRATAAQRAGAPAQQRVGEQADAAEVQHDGGVAEPGQTHGDPSSDGAGRSEGGTPRRGRDHPRRARTPQRYDGLDPVVHGVRGEAARGASADVIAILDKYEKKGEYEAPEYQETMMKQVYSRHVCRLDPWPEPLDRCFKHFNMKVYNTMQGPNEFVVTGNFKDWDRWKDLPQIKVPTLVVSGRYDEMNPEDMKREGKLIPNSRVVLCENGSHMCLWDDQEAYFRGLLGWIRDVETGRAGKKSA